MTPEEASALAAILAEKGYSLVPSADLDRLRAALHAAIEDCDEVGWDAARTTDLRPEAVHAAIDAALGDRAAEERRPLDEATDCGCVHGADEHYLGCLTCERYGRNHAALGDRAAEEGR